MNNKEKIINELGLAVANHGLINAVGAIFGKSAKINVGFSESLCRLPIEDISLSVRGYNALKRSNINTLGEIVDAVKDQRIKNLRNLGEKTIKEINSKIINLAYESLNEKEKKSFLDGIVELNAKVG